MLGRLTWHGTEGGLWLTAARNRCPQSDNPQRTGYYQWPCKFRSNIKWHGSSAWHFDCSPVRPWSRGPSKAMPWLLTNRNHEIINVYFFRLLSLWYYCCVAIINTWCFVDHLFKQKWHSIKKAVSSVCNSSDFPQENLHTVDTEIFYECYILSHRVFQKKFICEGIES